MLNQTFENKFFDSKYFAIYRNKQRKNKEIM